MVYSYYGKLDENGGRTGYGRTVTDLGMTAYEGMYRGDKRNGKGTYYYKDGTLCYSGDWSENARDGVGIGVSSRDGSMHIGRWSDNKPEGTGVRVTADGDISFISKELPDGALAVLRCDDENKLVVTKYNKSGNMLFEKTVSLIDC